MGNTVLDNARVFNRPVFVGMSRATVVLHWHCFTFAAKLPNLPARTRQRLMELGLDYSFLIAGQATPYTIAAKSDRLAFVDLANLTGMAPQHIEEFYAVRESILPSESIEFPKPGFFQSRLAFDGKEP